ncbi:pyrroloquinoline quinone precursor peptide PqqA [Salinisphaera orenii]|nr:pyrroloquinoline quinone precursor peptide PqqA [Salinisphaera orenii]
MSLNETGIQRMQISDLEKNMTKPCLAWTMHYFVCHSTQSEEIGMKQWTTPTAHDMRLGFEITMYVSNR